MPDRILVVDDEADVCYVFQKYLSRHGYDTVTVNSFQEGLEQLETGHFDLIFSDIMLGGKNGIDLLQEIRRLGIAAPVVMITGYPNMETVTEALRLGAFDYLSKPVLLDNLLRVTRRALEQYALRKENQQFRAHLEAIFRSVQDAIVTVDRDLVLTEMNEAMERICGFHRADALGKPMQEMACHCLFVCRPAFEEAIREARPVTLPRIECRHHSRADIILNVRAAPLLNDQGAVIGSVAVMTDETRMVSMEKQLQEKRQFHRLVGKGERMQRVYTLVEQLADTPTTVLITGESGTGKELVAEALHLQGGRGDEAPLVKVNCAALTDSLLESELFGHVKGAFTGAVRNKIGRFEMAHNGTLFLDEIGDISPNIQLKLLRVIQEKEFERVGDSRPVKVEFRLIAATNRDLRRRVEEGNFRQDLYYRLNVVQVVMPPLRERREDIPLLAEHFLQRFNHQFGKKIQSISHEVQQLFMRYSWPGNVREMEHAIEHAFILCRESVILLEHLPPDLLNDPRHVLVAIEEVASPEREERESSREEVLEALEKARWNKTRAAALLGVSRRTIYRWMERFQIPVEND